MAESQNPVAEQQKEIATATGAQQIAVVPPTPKPPIVASDEVLAITPRDLDEAWRYSEMIFRSGTAPDSYDNDPKKIIIGVLAAMELGVPPMTGLRNIAIINKRPAIWGDLAIALCQSKGVIQKFEHHYTGEEDTSVETANAFPDNYTCHVTIWRRGQESPYEGHYSVRDAKRAGLWMNPRKRPWIESPKRMLFNRARAFPLRDGFADCLAGLAIAEEVSDMPTEPKVLEAGILDDAPEIETTATVNATNQAA